MDVSTPGTERALSVKWCAVSRRCVQKTASLLTGRLLTLAAVVSILH